MDDEAIPEFIYGFDSAPAPAPSSGGPSAGAIAGAVLAAIFGAGCLGLIAWVCMKRSTNVDRDRAARGGYGEVNL